MKTQKVLFISLILFPLIFNCTNLFGQDLDSLIKSKLGSDYSVEGVFNVDKILGKPRGKVDKSVAYIFEDPNHQLQHCVIVTYGKWDSSKEFNPPGGSGVVLNDKGGIVIIRNGKIVWHSKQFILYHSGLSSGVSGFADFNDDGVTDILFSVFEGERHEYESLWVITPDSNGGRLLNEVDEEGRSNITGETVDIEITNVRNSKVKQIQKGDVLYLWNSSIFTDQVPLKTNKKK